MDVDVQGIDVALARRYAVDELLGSGGFASVFKAVQKTTGQEVALKLLRFQRSGDAPSLQEQVERFRLETRICAELHHPNIVPLIDSGQAGDAQIYAVFALVPGCTLGDLLATGGPLETAEALHLMTQVADALSCAHAAGVVHRDLKPQNIMVNASGARRNAQVLDFGLGALLHAAPGGEHPRARRGEYVGTPAYSAPEQLRGEPPTPSADLYAFGLILIECLTGTPVMGMRAPHEVIHRQLAPEPIAIPEALADHPLGELLRALTHKDPRRRTISAAEVLRELERIAREPLPALHDAAPASWPPARSPSLLPPATASQAGGIWMVPLQRNPNFTDRDDLFGQTAAALGGSRSAVVCICGLGGVGKTQLALEYAYRHSARYTITAWVRAERPETLAADYCAIARALGLPQTPNQRRQVESVRAWLEHNADWLLVFDNAPSPAAIRAYLPRSASGHILVTSRHQAWRELATSLALDVLPQDAAIEFVIKRSGQRDGAAAAQLCESLGCLPLALEEASAYLEATGRSIAGYLPLLRSQQRRMLLEAPIPGRTSSLRTTWELSYRQVESEDPAALDLLKLCAFFAPDDIPLSLLQQVTFEGEGGLGDLVMDDVTLDVCIATLQRYSLCKVESDSISLHRLVQLTTRERLPADERERWAFAALRTLEAAYPVHAAAGAYHPDSGRLLSHAMAALGHAAPHSRDPVVAGRLLRRAGVYLSARGLHDEASVHLHAALDLLEHAERVEDEQVAGALWDLGMVQYALGEVAGARESLERGLSLLERAPEPTPLVVAQIRVALVWVTRTAGDFAAALAHARRCLEIVQEAVPPEHPLTATAHALLARVLFGLNRLDEARASMRAAQRSLDAGYQGNHPLNCGTWYILAQLELDLGELDRAIEYAARALDIGERAYGRDHPLVCIALCVHGSALRRKGAAEPARRSLERAVRGGELSCRYLHEDVAIARSELALLLAASGNAEGARQKLEHALEERSRLCGHLARVEGHARSVLGLLHRERGALTEARAECEGGLRLVEAHYGAEHPFAIFALNALGFVLRDAGDTAGARERFERAAAIATAANLEQHAEHATTLEGLGLLDAGAGDLAAARARFERAYAVCRSRLGDAHPDTRRLSMRCTGE